MLHFFYRTVVLFIKYLLSYCFTFIRIHLDIERNFSAMQLSSQTLSLSEKQKNLADAAKIDVKSTTSGLRALPAARTVPENRDISAIRSPAVSATAFLPTDAVSLC